MSENVTKTALRMRVDSLTGKDWTEAWEIISPILGGRKSCSDFDEDEGEVLWFEYPDYRFHQEGKNWYVDYILNKEYSCDHPGLAMQIQRLNEKALEFANKFGQELSWEAINIIAVTWYNGVDEPFEFEE